MTRTGHQASGIGAAAIAIALNYYFGGSAHWLAALAALPGATAPDWMEIPRWSKNGGVRRLITHRTWTHWLPLWVIALAFSLMHVKTEIAATAAMGFVVGGLMHLAMDVPNPTGIPVVRPTRKRFSFRLWKSDQMVFPMVLVSWGAGYLALKLAKVF